MNNDTFERLKNFETHLRRGYYGGYCYGLYQKDFDELLVYYKALGGRENLKYSCQACVLRLVKFVAEKYFKEKERLEKLEKEREKEQEAVVEQPVEQPVVEEPVVEEPVVEQPEEKPRGRKKKEAE